MATTYAVNRPSTATPTRPAPRMGRLAPPTRRILVVDDSPAMHAVIRSMLRDDNVTSWDMVAASSGPGLLDAVSSQGPFDVILLDVQMPGMDGFTACSALRERGCRVPVVFVTAETDLESFRRGRASGGDSYLVKPFSATALRAGLHVFTSMARRETATPPDAAEPVAAGR
jgi:CheY-like chemotaxis protein